MPEETPEYKPEPDRFWFIALCQDDGYYWPDCRAVRNVCLIGAETIGQLIQSVEESYDHDPKDPKSTPSVKDWLEMEDLLTDIETLDDSPDEAAHNIEQYSIENGSGGVRLRYISYSSVPPSINDTADAVDDLSEYIEDNVGSPLVIDCLNAMELGEAITLWHRGRKQHPIHIV